MGALVAILQNDASLMRCQVARLGAQVALAGPERPPDAYGFGYYSRGDVLLGKRPSGSPAPLSLAQLVGEVRTDLLVAHARHAAIGDHKEENTQPFRFRRWLFGHDGTLEDFDAVRPRLLDLLPDHLRRSIEGETDTEHVFMLFLELLRAQGRLDDLDLDAEAAGELLARTVRLVDGLCRDAGVQRPSALNLVATNGRVLAATRRGRPLFYALLEGIPACPIHRLAPGEASPEARAHRVVKAVCLATRLLSPAGFLEVPEGSVVTVSRDLRLAIAPIGNHGGAWARAPGSG
jgi:predicted glutamine amidotransferase